MKTVAFVPVKMNNERLPGKNTKCFSDGKPLITLFLESLKKVQGIDDIFVYCSTPAIKAYCTENIQFLQRPSFLDQKDATPQDIIREFIKAVPADIYMTAHCTSPFVSTKHLEECIEAVKSGTYDSSFTAEKLQKLLWKENGIPLNFQADAIPRTQDLDPLYSEVSAAYVFKREVFEKYQRRIGLSPHITVVSGLECIDIDWKEDFEVADAIYMNIIRMRQE